MDEKDNSEVTDLMVTITIRLEEALDLTFAGQSSNQTREAYLGLARGLKAAAEDIKALADKGVALTDPNRAGTRRSSDTPQKGER